MLRARIKITTAILFVLWFLCLPSKGNAQEIESDSLTRAVLAAADSSFVPVPVKEIPKEAFKPNPTKAILFGLIPGMGQVYNRKYWKLPLVYGGFMGFMYAITWNNKNYQDYWKGYKSMMTDAELYQQAINEAGSDVDYDFSKDWTELFNSTGDSRKTDVFNTSWQNQLKSKKDYFRRYRDLSIILGIGFYALTLIDAYVDAQLFDFDISPDLSMRVEPVYSPQTRYSSRNVGLNCSFTF